MRGGMMINLNQDILSLTDFKRKTPAYMRRMKNRHRPMVLTVNGRAALVVQDPDSYQHLVDLADRFEAIVAVNEAMKQSAKGQAVPLKQFDQQMRRKHGIPR